MFVRIYTGDDGQTHFEDLDLPADRSIHSGMQVTPGVNFRRFEPGYFSDWHTAPRRQYVITLAGEMEIGIGGRHQAPLRSRRRADGRRPHRPGPHHRRSGRSAPRVGHHPHHAMVAVAARRRGIVWNKQTADRPDSRFRRNDGGWRGNEGSSARLCRRAGRITPARWPG